MWNGKKVLFASLALLGLGTALLSKPVSAQITPAGSAAGEDNLAPAPITDLSATADLAAVNVALSWSLSADDYFRQSPTGPDFTSGGTFTNVNDVAEYRIWRAEGTGDAVVLETVASGTSEYTDASVASGTAYTYSVTAVDEAGNESSGVTAPPVSLGPPPTSEMTLATGVFGEVDAAETATQTITVANTSDDPDAILAVVAEIVGAGFSMDPASVLLQPGESATMTLIFDPMAVGQVNGEYTGELVLRSNDPDAQEQVIALSATIINGFDQQEIDVTPGLLAFQQVLVHSTATRTLTITNTGDLELAGTVTLEGDAEFTCADAGSFSLAGGASKEVEVSFMPSDTVRYGAMLTVASNDVDEPEILVAVSGKGVTEIELVLKGDFNSDNVVNFNDFFSFVGAFGTTSADPEYDPKYDLEPDGSINLIDFLTFAEWFGRRIENEQIVDSWGQPVALY